MIGEGGDRITDGPVLDDLAGDLRTLIGLRTRTAVRDRHLPALYALIDKDNHLDRDRRYGALRDLVDGALDAVADPDHQQAARILAEFGPGRWRALKQRGAEAAAVFGIGWDGYRRKREATGASLLQATMDELAEAVAATAVGEPRPQPELNAALEPPPSHRGSTGRRLALAGLVLLIVGAAVALLIRGTGSDVPGLGAAGATSPEQHTDRCANLTAHVGDTREHAGALLRRWATPFRRAAATLPAGAAACAAPIETERGHIFQRISAGDGDAVGALVATPTSGPDAVVVLDDLEFGQFAQDELKEEDPMARLGAPVRRVDRPGSARLVTYTQGITFQEAEETPARSVTQRIWRYWRSLGGLDGRPGPPLSDPYGVPDVGLVQEFEGGRTVVDYRTGEPRWEPATAADRRLPDRYRGSILVATDRSTSWFVDQKGVRHWILGDVDFACATRSQDAKPIRAVSPQAITTLRIGKPFRCR